MTAFHQKFMAIEIFKKYKLIDHEDIITQITTSISKLLFSDFALGTSAKTAMTAVHCQTLQQLTKNFSLDIVVHITKFNQDADLLFFHAKVHRLNP